MEKENWKELEYVVSRIHDAYIPFGEVVWNESIEDIDTGESRQVDVTVKIKDQNGVDRLIAFECRDRKGLQDVTWIEQLIAKKNSIGADVLVAVTRNGLTNPARIKAEKHNIYIRRVEELSREEALNIVNNQFILYFTQNDFIGYNAFSNGERLFDCENGQFLDNDMQYDFLGIVNQCAQKINMSIVRESMKDSSNWAKYSFIGPKYFKIARDVYMSKVNDIVNIEIWFAVKYITESYFIDRQGQYFIENPSTELQKEAEYFLYDHKDHSKKLSMIYNTESQSVCFTVIYTNKPKNYGFVRASCPALLYPCKEVLVNSNLPGFDSEIIIEISEFGNVVQEETIGGERVINAYKCS